MCIIWMVGFLRVIIFRSRRSDGIWLCVLGVGMKKRWMYMFLDEDYSLWLYYLCVYNLAQHVKMMDDECIIVCTYYKTVTVLIFPSSTRM